MVLGKHSGRHAFREKLRELGYSLTEEDINRAFERFIELADKKKAITDRDIEAIIETGRFAVPGTFILEYVHVVSGNTTVPTATVRIRHGDEVVEEAACGDGPIDAVYRAINRATKVPVHLLDYALQAVTGGADALGDATVRVKDNGHIHIGRGTSTDVIEASALAYVHAINKIVNSREKYQSAGEV